MYIYVYTCAGECIIAYICYMCVCVCVSALVCRIVFAPCKPTCNSLSISLRLVETPRTAAESPPRSHNTPTPSTTTPHPKSIDCRTRVGARTPHTSRRAHRTAQNTQYNIATFSPHYTARRIACSVLYTQYEHTHTHPQLTE